MYLPNSSDRMWYWVNFLVEYSWFEFWVFLLLDWLLNQGKNLPCYLLITGVEQLDSFSKSISSKWNTNNLFQDLNSGYQFHFLQQNCYTKPASSPTGRIWNMINFQSKAGFEKMCLVLYEQLFYQSQLAKLKTLFSFCLFLAMWLQPISQYAPMIPIQ